MLGVHRADVRDDGNVRLRNAREVRHLAEMVHSHFQHRDLHILLQRHDAHRKSEVIIVVALALGGAERALQRARHHFLRRGLAHAAGDADHARVQQLAVVCRQRAVGTQRIGNAELQNRRVHLMRHQRRGSACLGCLCNVSVSVGALARQGDEEVACADLARVGADPGHAHAVIFLRRRRAAPQRDLIERQFLHFCLSKCSATTSRSSRCRL